MGFLDGVEYRGKDIAYAILSVTDGVEAFFVNIDLLSALFASLFEYDPI